MPSGPTYVFVGTSAECSALFSLHRAAGCCATAVGINAAANITTNKLTKNAFLILASPVFIF
jgi:hypothetical protein